MSKVITISREFGSGGREIGFRLSEKLGIPFYDKEIISLAAQDSNIAEKVFHANDEVIGRKVRVDQEYVSVNPFSPLYEVPVSDQIFLAQSQMIRKLEQEGPCIIIGRCSDIIVEAIDRKRRDYYQYYSGNEWGNPRNYHLSLNSGKLGVETCVEIIANNVDL